MTPRDLREHLVALEQNKLLHRVTREINKDTELSPLVRWQFRGLRQRDRFGFLFERVMDSRGISYTIPVVSSVYGPSHRVMAIGMGCEVAEINPRWAAAVREPIAPIMVSDGPCQEVVHQGTTLTEHGGLLEFPFPIYTPGFDPGPYTSASHWISKNPSNGVRNVGNYRAQIKSQTRTGLFHHPGAHMRAHWLKARARRQPLPAALMIGTAPAITYSAVSHVGADLDELAIAGALIGEPVELVRCVSIDLEVPALAEIVIEGHVSTEYMEPEAPFGEYLGYQGQRCWGYVFDVTAITHRRDPILATVVSQMPPSEASVMSTLRRSAGLYNHLTRVRGFSNVKGVDIPEWASGFCYIVIRVGREPGPDVKEILEAAAASDRTIGRVLVAIDDDIDGHDAEAVNWSMCWRVEPHRDVRIIHDRESSLDCLPVSPPEMPLVGYFFPLPGQPTSSLLIDATRKRPYPPVSLPARPYMERARELWVAEGLPTLEPKSIWHGYDLGAWGDLDRMQAERAVEGRYLETGEWALGQRRMIDDLQSPEPGAPPAHVPK